MCSCQRVSCFNQMPEKSTWCNQATAHHTNCSDKHEENPHVEKPTKLFNLTFRMFRHTSSEVATTKLKFKIRN